MKKLILALLITVPALCTAKEAWNCYDLKFNSINKEQKLLCVSSDNTKTTGLFSTTTAYTTFDIIEALSSPLKITKVDETKESFKTILFSADGLDAQMRLDYKFNTTMEQEFDDCDYTANTFEYKVNINGKQVRTIGTYKFRNTFSGDF